jgi:hypothetical protein
MANQDSIPRRSLRCERERAEAIAERVVGDALRTSFNALVYGTASIDGQLTMNDVAAIWRGAVRAVVSDTEPQ